MRCAALTIRAIAYVAVIATFVAVRTRNFSTRHHPSDDLSQGDQSAHEEC